MSRPRLTNLLAGLSLLLCVAVAGLYVRAFTARDALHTSVFGRDCIVATFPHHAHVILAGHPRGVAHPSSLTPGLAQYPSRAKYLQPRLTSTGRYWEISIPFWLPLLFAAALPLWAAAEEVRRHRSRAAGLCPACGYDLRATPERCPECGNVTAAAAAAAAAASHA